MGSLTSNKTTFAKGRSKTGGRRAGTPNKSTRMLKEAVLLAAEAAGNKKGRGGVVSYLTWGAKNQPASFMALLARILPLQIEAKQTSHTEVIYRSVADIRQELLRRGISAEALERLALANQNSDESQP